MNVYSSAAAMRHLEVWQSAVTQNIAAGQQPGYKALQISLERPPAEPSGKQLPMIAHLERDFSSATARRTNRDLDVALSGDGFIVAQDAREKPVLVRNGELYVNASGRLVNGNGLEIDGRDGPIQVVPSQPDPRIDPTGEVWQGETSIGRIRIVTVPDPSVLDYDGSGWRLPPGQFIELTPVDDPGLMPGYLEDGNYSPLRSMISLMQITRAYEANMKAAQTVDEAEDRSIRSVQ